MEINIVKVCVEPTVLSRVAVLSALIYPFIAGVALWVKSRRSGLRVWSTSVPFLMGLFPAAFTLGIAWIELAAAERAVRFLDAGAVFAAALIAEFVPRAFLGAALSIFLVIIVALIKMALGRRALVSPRIAGSRAPVTVVVFLGLAAFLLVFFSLDLVGRAPDALGIAIHLTVAAVCVLTAFALFASLLFAAQIGRAQAGSSLLVAGVLVFTLSTEGAFLYTLSRQMYNLSTGARVQV